MNRLFVRALATILGAVLIVAALLAGLAVVGLQRSIAEWDRARDIQLKALAEDILRERPSNVNVPDNTPLFVYDAAGDLVFSNRGQAARQRPGTERTAVLADGLLLGYYQAAPIRFRGDSANDRFLQSLYRSFWLGLALSLLVAVGFALLFSRSLSAPSVRMARALDRITHGDLTTVVQPGGARELAMIGDSVDRLRLRLLKEEELRRQWVHDVTHDLRTPVAALSAQLEGMRDGVLEVSRERLDKVLRELDRVQELVMDLDELMRLESPEMRISVESLDARDVVEDARERFEHVLRAKKIRFLSQVAPVQILGDPNLIQRALSNFLANATRHCPEGGSVTVTVELREATATVSVANSGDPIPVQDLERVFDRLFRGEYARHTSGSGLGLTIARRIARLHGGEVRIANRSDGVIVEMLLPQPDRHAEGSRVGTRTKAP